ncbi:MAG: hypothetical protein OXU81_19470 [Gammaproteobacteria bacterium]|nr:hypothetical protein [Gammaproteobacteria bacterium]
MPNDSPDLRFGPGSNQGFTGIGVATFDDLRPAAVVRELIQNALDAARKAQVLQAVVRFRLSETRRESIPGMASYKCAFEKAIASQRDWTDDGELASQADLVVDRIREALDEELLDVLTVFDNGIGLNEQRMNALLSDGLSVKEGNATGTYGNGHATAIPASDLRYVLYGGITENGNRIGAGHAVLASHIEEGEAHVRAGDGFYIRDFQAGRGTLYAYATGDDLPDFIADAVDDIESSTGHGTAVIIPAFNNFLEIDSLWEMVAHAASANFFVAIEDGELEVVVEDFRYGGEDKQWLLNKATLAQVLDTYRDKRRARAFLNGRRAFEAHKAYQTGKRHRIETSAGNIEIRLLETPSGTPRVDLCRNGMWIADDRRIPGFYQKFTDKVPFQAVLSLDAEAGRDLHDLIRIAEGPLHDSIAIKRLPKQRRKECQEALGEIVNWIMRNTPSVKSDAYVAHDFLTLDFGYEGGKGAGKSRRGFWGVPVAVNRNPARQLLLFAINPNPNDDDPVPIPDPDDDRRKRRKAKPKGERARPSLPTFFRAASRPAGKSRHRILIECVKDYANAEFRLVVDEALDATCERHGQDAYTPAMLSNVTINGKSASEADYVRWDEGVIGVRLGDLNANASIEIETDYRLTGDFVDLPTPSLRVEVLRSEQHPPAAS